MSAYTIDASFEGNLTEDPVLRHTNQDGLPVCNFRVAVTSRRRNGTDFVDSTEYMNVVAWRGMAENAAATLRKGTRVVVSGQVKARMYQDKDGNTREIREVHANTLGVSLRWHVVAGIEKASEALADAETVTA